MSDISGSIYFLINDRLSPAEHDALINLTRILSPAESLSIGNTLWHDNYYRAVTTFSLKRDNPGMMIYQTILPIISTHAFILQFRDETGRQVTVREYEGSNCVYSMTGKYAQGRYSVKNDRLADYHPGSSIFVKIAQHETVIYKTRDNHLFVRRFGPVNTAFSIDGYIEGDVRPIKKVFIILENEKYLI